MSGKHCGFHGKPLPCPLCAADAAQEPKDGWFSTVTKKVLICGCPVPTGTTDFCALCGQRTREAAARALDAFLSVPLPPEPERPLPAEDGSTTEACVDLLRQRHHHGLSKYGVTLDRKDLDAEAWCQHHLEELADAIGYTMRQREEMRSLRETVRHGEGVNSALRDVVKKQQAELASLREQNKALTAALEEQP